MGKFVSELRVTFIDDTRASLNAPLVFVSDLVGTIEVPGGFLTDFASVPRIPCLYFFLGGVARLPAVVHDYLYRNGMYTRKTCDKVFLEAMKVAEIGLIVRWLLYMGVRFFGEPFWRGSGPDQLQPAQQEA